jgi:hypothetical protein
MLTPTPNDFVSLVARLTLRTIDDSDDGLEDSVVTLHQLIGEARRLVLGKKPTKQQFTVWATSNYEVGHYIQCVEAPSLEKAYAMVIKECATAWGCPKKEVYIRGSAKGDVAIIEWNDDNA